MKKTGITLVFSIVCMAGSAVAECPVGWETLDSQCGQSVCSCDDGLVSENFCVAAAPTEENCTTDLPVCPTTECQVTEEDPGDSAEFFAGLLGSTISSYGDVITENCTTKKQRAKYQAAIQKFIQFLNKVKKTAGLDSEEASIEITNAISNAKDLRRSLKELCSNDDTESES